MLPKAPCLNCQDRASACHDTCEKYIAYKTKREQIRHIESKERLLNANIYHLRQIKKKK